MKPFLAFLCLMFGLTACEEREMVAVPMDLGVLAQSWTVTDAKALQNTMPPPPLGQKYLLGNGPTTLGLGQSCRNTTVKMGEAPLSAVLGATPDTDLGDLDRMVPIYTLSCQGQPLVTFARLRPEILITRQGQWLIWLRPSRYDVKLPLLQ